MNYTAWSTFAWDSIDLCSYVDKRVTDAFAIPVRRK